MQRNLLLILAILTCFQVVSAQKASDVIENGIRIKTGQKLFLQLDNNILKFDIAKSLQDITNPPDFITLEDSTIFLVTKKSVNIYLRPLNPLNFSYNTESKVIIDPINEAAIASLGSIINSLETVNSMKFISVTSKKSKEKALPSFEACGKFKTLKNRIDSIQIKLVDNKKTKIIEIFKNLKALDFIDETRTINNLEAINTSITEIEKHFNDVVSLIDEIKMEVKNYNCIYPEAFIAKYIFNSILKDLATTNAKQKKRLDNLKLAYDLVRNAQNTASVGGGENGLRWCYKLNGAQSKEGKISIYTITIKESGYKLSGKKEIVSIESKDVLKKTIRVRKFQRFIPEVSVGTVFTFLKYNSYGTTSDSTGQQFVSSPTENTVRNMNITTMLNFNYYIPNSSIHPLYQIGVGINSGIPTILTGFGLRSNINGIKRLTISSGIAMTWIKELDKLKVGDEISGTDDIDKDYKYSSAPKFSPYVGLQYNF